MAESQTILIIRHAEKPDPDGDSGVDGSGNPDPKSLTPRGWQRAGIWTELFVPSLKETAKLPTPNAIFASAPAGKAEIEAIGAGSKSRRPLQTVSALAAKLAVHVNLQFSKGQEAQMAVAIASAGAVVLVCWQHEDIYKIAQALGPTESNVPSDWPENRFNIIYCFTRSPSNWRFSQIVPVMLQGDLSDQL